jgi:ATP-dependent Clp protease ATP-binding subunit ClpB
VLDLGKRLEDRDISLTATDAALDQVLRESYNPSYGARPMRRYIDKHLATDLARMAIAGTLLDHSEVEIGAGAAEGQFAYRVTRKAAVSAGGGSGSGGSAGFGGGRAM